MSTISARRRLGAKLDRADLSFGPFSMYREAVARLDRTAASDRSIDRMLQGVRIYDQIGGSCCGHAIAQAASAVTECNGGRVHFSALAAYYLGRLEEWKLGHPNAPPPPILPEDGTFPYACQLAWRIHGLPTEATWPHVEKNLQEQPGWGAVAESSVHQATDLFAVDSDGDQMLRDIELNLRANHPVMVTIPVSPAIEDHWGWEPIDAFVGPLLGFHRLPILGMTWDGDFIGPNSWGTSWGDAGLFRLSPKFLSLNARDVHVLTEKVI